MAEPVTYRGSVDFAWDMAKICAGEYWGRKGYLDKSKALLFPGIGILAFAVSPFVLSEVPETGRYKIDLSFFDFCNPSLL